ncbi:hypothetical protein FA95DRAFT_515899 [Auriscalpium vulgare]|uniref:Uncharacterized protein n=1 Tax=Auriscalpium vulgare TaxID=40419 RepID=A0ACB8RGJ8_9AGAM|nr:hypothetical protein FA95DRAFT_515899 [Auriscalpium vulgare]
MSLHIRVPTQADPSHQIYLFEFVPLSVVGPCINSSEPAEGGNVFISPVRFYRTIYRKFAELLIGRVLCLRSTVLTVASYSIYLYGRLSARTSVKNHGFRHQLFSQRWSGATEICDDQ